MRHILSLMMISVLAFFMGCQTASSSSTETKNENPAETKPAEKADAKKPQADSKEASDGHNHNDEAPRISLADAKKSFDEGNVIFVDTRSAVAYKNERIKGALSVPAGQFEKTYNKIPKDKKIITYCS